MLLFSEVLGHAGVGAVLTLGEELAAEAKVVLELFAAGVDEAVPEMIFEGGEPQVAVAKT